MLVQQEKNEEAAAERAWGGYRAKRTEAIPTASLFGSSLEIKGDKQRAQLKNIAAKSVTFKSQGGKKLFTKEKIVLPESADFLIQEKQKFVEEHLAALEAKKAAETVEEKRKNFAEVIEQQPPKEKPVIEQVGKFTRSDLENALLMNNVGYNNGRSYNHHKYMPRPPEHQYALIGNAVQTGGDLLIHRNDYKRYPKEAYITRPIGKRRDPLPAIKPKDDTQSPPEVLGVSDLPANIRHHFGTSVCHAAFANPRLVRESLMETRKSSRMPTRSMLKPLNASDYIENKLDPNYEALGLSTRQNIFPGFTYDHKISHTKMTHSPEVHRRRVPDPDQWRYQRDELGIWNEHDTLYRILHKRWQAYEESQPKPEPNWDRNAKRPPKPPEPPTPKPKKKLPPKKQEAPKETKIEDDLVFEDIEFKTPPLSPPYKPPPADLIPALPTDDDFWDFYDQALPLP